MVLNDYIKQANEILMLPINFTGSYANDENYKQLYRCAVLVLNTLTDKSDWTGSTEVSVGDTIPATVVYGILTEYAFVAGMLNEWKVWKKQYGDLLFRRLAKKNIQPMPRTF
jgi:hypothetical protein